MSKEAYEKYIFLMVHISITLYIYINVRRFGEYTSNRHNISVALDPHEMPK